MSITFNGKETHPSVQVLPSTTDSPSISFLSKNLTKITANTLKRCKPTKKEKRDNDVKQETPTNLRGQKAGRRVATESTGQRERTQFQGGQEASAWWHRPRKGVGMSGIRKCRVLGWDENTGLFCKPVRRGWIPLDPIIHTGRDSSSSLERMNLSGTGLSKTRQSSRDGPKPRVYIPNNETHIPPPLPAAKSVTAASTPLHLNPEGVWRILSSGES